MMKGISQAGTVLISLLREHVSTIVPGRPDCWGSLPDVLALGKGHKFMSPKGKAVMWLVVRRLSFRSFWLSF